MCPATLDSTLVSKLAAWAASKPTIQALHIFGSYAKGTATPSSDLDLAFDFIESVDDSLAELIMNANAWKAEVTTLTGIPVKDVYLTNSHVVINSVIVFRRDPNDVS